MLKNQLRLYTCVVFLKTNLILNQNGKNVHRPVFVPERLKNHIYGGTIYLYNLFITSTPSQLLRRLSVNVVKSNHRW